MRIWVVSSNGTPCATFSTAGSAQDYIDGCGCASSHDISWFVLDACDDRHTQRVLPRAANANRVTATRQEGRSGPRE
jgi:hypothetical protein